MTASLFDYGAGNLHSLAKGLEAGGARVRIEMRCSFTHQVGRPE